MTTPHHLRRGQRKRDIEAECFDSIMDTKEMQAVTFTQIVQDRFNTFRMAEAERTHRKGKAFSVIDIGCSPRMRVSVQDRLAVPP